MGSNPIPSSINTMRYTHKGYVNIYAKVMTKKMAKEVEELKKSSTYRALATKFSEKHPELRVLKGNQLEGIEICNAAEAVLGRKLR